MVFDKRNPNSNPPNPLEYDPQTIPAALRESPHCGLWIWKLNSAGTYWTKVSVDKHGTPVDCRTFSMTFPQAVKVQKKIGAHGIGFYFSPNNNYLGIDLDDCVKDGVISKKAQKIIDKLNTYWEFSVSGTGIHIIGKGSQLINGVDEKIVFHNTRFFTFSGNGQGELKNIGKKVNKRFRKHTSGNSNNPNPSPSDISISDITKTVSSIRPDLPESAWWDVCKAIHHKTNGSDKGWQLFNAWSAGVMGGVYEDYSERECRKKWDRCSLDKDHLVGMPRLKEIAAEYPIEKTRLDMSAFKDGGQDPDSDEEDATTAAKTLEDTKVKKMKWRMKNWIPSKKLMIFAAEGGSGKSSILYDLAARETSGQPFPFSKDSGSGGKVIYVTAEDDIADTIKPRFMAAGGDPSKLIVLNSEKIHIDLSTDGLVHLQKLLDHYDGVSMVIIDPIDSYCGTVNTHMASVVKSLMGPVNSFARKNNVTVCGVLHFNKMDLNKVSLKNMISGSASWVNSARLAIVAFEDPGSDEKYMGIAKSNNGSKKWFINYRVKIKDEVVRIKFVELVNEHIQKKAAEIFNTDASVDIQFEILEVMKKECRKYDGKCLTSPVRDLILMKVEGSNKALIRKTILKRYKARNIGGKFYYIPKK